MWQSAVLDYAVKRAGLTGAGLATLVETNQIAPMKPQPAPASASAPVLWQQSDAIAFVTLDSPATRNCLSLAMMANLREVLVAIAADPGINVVLLAASGPVFCAGHDLKELTAHRADADGGHGFFRHTMAQCSGLMQAMLAMPQPVIAVVEGLATAAGCQLVATCDLAVAGENAGFCTPGVDIGLFCSTPAVALSRNLARKHVMEMLLTGERISAQTALAMGLVNRLAPAGEALAMADGLARHIAAKPAATIAAGKRAFYAQADMPLHSAYDHASAAMAENLLGAEAKEGIGAFLEKRAPSWPRG